MLILDYKSLDVLNGQGTRSSLWLAGCSHQCEGCFAQSTWTWKGSTPESIGLYDRVERDMNDPIIKRKGISLLGGDPLYERNRAGLLEFLVWFKSNFPTKDVWLWTGYLHEQCLEDPAMSSILEYVDVLIDGRFEQERKNLNLQWRGSENQRVINLKETKCS